MSFSINTGVSEEHAFNAWSQLPDIEMVTDSLSMQDQTFLDSVGSLLVKARQTSRFAIALLHSHFEVRADECLVEAFDQGQNQIITTVQPLTATLSSSDFIANSWMFTDGAPENGVDALEVLTWTNKANIPQTPLSESDAELIRELATLFRDFKVTHLFGMALVGRLADSDKIWTEGTDFLGRRLVQEQLPLSEVALRNPIKTLWVFDEEGKFLITRGCCYRFANGNGHTGRRHPNGIHDTSV